MDLRFHDPIYPVPDDLDAFQRSVGLLPHSFSESRGPQPRKEESTETLSSSFSSPLSYSDTNSFLEDSEDESEQESEDQGTPRAEKNRKALVDGQQDGSRPRTPTIAGFAIIPPFSGHVPPDGAAPHRDPLPSLFASPVAPLLASPFTLPPAAPALPGSAPRLSPSSLPPPPPVPAASKAPAGSRPPSHSSIHFRDKAKGLPSMELSPEEKTLILQSVQSQPSTSGSQPRKSEAHEVTFDKLKGEEDGKKGSKKRRKKRFSLVISKDVENNERDVEVRERETSHSSAASDGPDGDELMRARALTMGPGLSIAPFEDPTGKKFPVMFQLMKVTVVNAVKVAEAGHRLIPQTLCTIRLSYGPAPYVWTIQKSFSEIIFLHSQLKVIHLTSRKADKLPPPPANPLNRDQKNLEPLRIYLQQLCLIRHQTTAKQLLCAFFCCSAHSFIPGYGPKPFEGYADKLSGGRINDGTISKFARFFSKFSLTLHSRWVVIGEHYVSYYDSLGDATPQEVLLCDPYFKVGLKSKRGKVGIAIENGYRKLFLAPPKQNLDDFLDAATKVAHLSEWSKLHRFESFAPEREHVPVKFFVDGFSYFEDLATALKNAKASIFIAGWWISPELFLRRPPVEHEDSRLDNLLKDRALNGVQIHILVFEEMAGSLSNDSKYTKETFQKLHPNISVIRFPDHVSSGTYKWANHEKIVIVDQKVGFLGGIDLCFGRGDDSAHALFDFDHQIWLGKDYSNPMKKDFFELNKPMADSVNRNLIPRMPWHDIAMRIEGQPARDLARHFIGRWNFAKISKKKGEKHHLIVPCSNFAPVKPPPVGPASLLQTPAPPPAPHPQPPTTSQTFPLNPSHRAVAPPDGLPDGRLALSFLDRGLVSGSMRCLLSLSLSLLASTPFMHDQPPVGTNKVQIVRSISRWSGGTYTESSIMNALYRLIEGANHFVYIENQFFITNTIPAKGSIENNLGLALYRRIKEAVRTNSKFHVFVVMPLSPGFEGDITLPASVAIRKILLNQNRCISREHGYSLIEKLEAEGIEVTKYLSFHGLRNFGIRRGEYVTEQIYIHAKCCIIDDRFAVIGSANLNDRSLLGQRDSEVSAVVTDTQLVHTKMDGKDYEASRSIFNLRCQLFEEHLGLTPDTQLTKFGPFGHHHSAVEDPISQEFLEGVWLKTSQNNTRLFRESFHCVPDDTIATLNQLQLFVQQPGPDFETQRGLLSQVKGHLVDYPYYFLKDEGLGDPTLLIPDMLAPSDIFS